MLDLRSQEGLGENTQFTCLELSQERKVGWHVDEVSAESDLKDRHDSLVKRE